MAPPNLPILPLFARQRLRKQSLSPSRLFFFCACFLLAFFAITLILHASVPVFSIFRYHHSAFDSPPNIALSSNSSHKIWEPPDVDPVIHGMLASEASNVAPLYPLDPFPYTPMIAPRNETFLHRPWLAAVICSASDGARRMMIRSSWMRLYGDLPYDRRFVISNPGPQWLETIRQENRTFGDMIVLDNLHEDDFTANTVKTIAFYRWLLDKSPKKYEFVTKLDTDLWLNARAFWKRYLHPRLSHTNTAAPARSTVRRTIFGQLYYSPPHRVVFPHGSMYTVTWDMVKLLADLQDKHQVIAGEDMVNALLLLKSNLTATVVNFKGTEKFDYDDRDAQEGSAWAVPNTVPTSAEHALWGQDVIAVHAVKSDDAWIKVAACFDEHGIKKMPEPEPEEDEEVSEEELDGRSLPYSPETSGKDSDKRDDGGLKRRDDANGNENDRVYSMSRFEAIPQEYWEKYEEENRWVCNGIWKMERGVGPDPDRPKENWPWEVEVMA